AWMRRTGIRHRPRRTHAETGGVEIRERWDATVLLVVQQQTLAGVDLTGASLRRASLHGADLSGATLCKADLRGATLEDAVLSGDDLRGVILKDATLSGAALDGADFREADLRSILWEGADFSGARYDEHTQWPYGFNPARHCSLRGPVELSPAAPPA